MTNGVTKIIAAVATFIALTIGTVALTTGATTEANLPTAESPVETDQPPSTSEPSVDEVTEMALKDLDNFLAQLDREQKEAEAAAKRAASAPKTTPNYDPGDGSHWDALARCECGGNWACNTGNGFGGGLQFMHQSSYSTWLSFGGGEFAPHPWEASREQQIVVAERVLARSGWNAWPACSRKLGLR